MSTNALDINLSVADVAAIVDATDLQSIRAAGYLAGRFASYRVRSGDYRLAAHASWGAALVTQARLIEWRDLMATRDAVRCERAAVTR